MSNRIAISSNKNGLFVAEGLLLQAAAGRDGDSNDWDVSGSVRHSKKHLAECDWIKVQSPDLGRNPAARRLVQQS